MAGKKQLGRFLGGKWIHQNAKVYKKKALILLIMYGFKSLYHALPETQKLLIFDLSNRESEPVCGMDSTPMQGTACQVDSKR